MPTFSRHDIDSMAYKAVRKFNEGIPLHDTVVKLARDNSMNPEQIRRLVESSNTTAFLDRFNDKVGNQRMIEFDVADPTKVIDEALGSVSPSRDVPSVSITISVDGAMPSMYDSVENENETVPEAPDESSKVASYTDVGSVKLASLYEDTPLSGKHNMYRVRESLLDKVADCNYRASDLADELAREYRGIYTREKYASLEMDALSSFGNNAVPALQMLRSRLGMSKISSTLTPQGEYLLADRHVVDSSPALAKVAEIVEICNEHGKLSSTLKYLDKNL